MAKGVLTFVFAFLAVFVRCTMFIISPLWLDYFKVNETSQTNISQVHHGNSAQFFTLGKAVSPFIVFGLWLLYIQIFTPSKIGDFEKNYPKKYFAIIGSSQGLASVLFTYSISGSRTPAYLQGILANGHIPVQHLTRFLILRKKPTVIKICCAVAIIVAALVCLIPTIFPSLESTEAKTDDGGATGVGRVLWPLCFVASIVPFAICNTLTESSVQKEGTAGNNSDASKLNMVYFQFWRSVFVLITVAGFFWVDLIPGFGTSKNWQEFSENFQFDFLCLFGQEGCVPTVIILGWSSFLLHVVAIYSLPALMRYSEGANFVVIVLALRTPIVFLFWSLFDEQPFHWHPHGHLGTWLSIGAICIMLPSVVLYDTGDKCYTNWKRNHRKPDDPLERLVNDDGNVQYEADESSVKGSLISEKEQKNIQ